MYSGTPEGECRNFSFPGRSFPEVRFSHGREEVYREECAGFFPLGLGGIFLCGEGMDLCAVASYKYVLYLRIVLIPFNSLVFR